LLPPSQSSNNRAKKLPNDGGESHRQRAPECHSGCGAQNVGTARRVAPAARRAEEQFLDDRSIEFPRINDRLAGGAHAIVYAVETNNDIAAAWYSSVVKYDLKSGKTTRHDFESGLPSEFAHVPTAADHGEDAGWLIGFVYDRARNASDLVILNAQKIEAKPVARIGLPVRVPQGFHGNWMPDAWFQPIVFTRVIMHRASYRITGGVN
jgi:carotenoid cleavage dioxygenase-like enzyme